MAEELRFELLGGIHITQNREPVTGFMSNKALALLCYLAVTGQPHQRDFLAGLFWGELPEADAKNNLRQALANLRKLVGDHVEADRQAVAFNHALPHWIDAVEFEQRTAESTGQEAGGNLQSAICNLPSAIGLYRGDFLAGLNLREAPAFDEWLTVERERLRALAVSALAALIDHHTRRGDYPTAIPFARRLLGLDPWNEDAHRRVMLLLARTGQRSAALAQYETCRRLLADELGVEPAPDTIALVERLRSADSTRDHNLPAPATPLVGRDEELAELAGRLSAPGSRIVTLTGPGGIGKTRLALEAASRLRQNGTFLNGVYFIPLASVSASDLLVSTIADVCQFSFYSRDDPKAQLINYLRQKEMLLVLDNFEHLLDGAGLLADIARQAPEVKLLVTSRERLNLQGEWVMPLDGLAYPTPAAPGDGLVGWESYDAVRLFLQNAARAGADPALSAEEQRAVARICRLVEGMPLGIELASAWARALSYAEIARQIEYSLDFLAAHVRDMPERQRSLRAVFEHSWGLLPDDERAVFLRLSAFQSGFTVEAAGQVAGASLRDLSSLADKSLIRRDAAGRYQIHGLLRQYADGKLRADPPEFAEAQARHCEYYVEFLRAREAAFGGEGQKVATEEIAREIDNVRAAWSWAVAHQRIAALEPALESARSFYERAGRYVEAVELFGAAAEQARASGGESSPLRGKLLSRQAWFCFRLDRYEEARSLLRQSLALLRNAPLPLSAEEALCLQCLGHVAYGVGDYAEAREYFRQSLALRRAVGDRVNIARSLNGLGIVLTALGEFDEGRRLHEENLAIGRELGERRGIAFSLGNLGQVALSQHKYAEAKRFFREALGIHRENSDRMGAVIVLNNLGFTCYLLEEHAEARPLLQESLAICRELGHRHLAAYVLTNLGGVIGALGEYGEAWQCARQALQIAREIGSSEAMLVALLGAAGLLARQGERERAAEAAALVIRHPAARRETKDQAGQLISELESQLPAPVAAAAQERGRARQLEEVVAEILQT